MSLDAVFSASQMSAIIGQLQMLMTQPVDIWVRSFEVPPNPDTVDTDEVEIWTYTTTVNGWLIATPPNDAQVVGGIPGSLSVYKLFLPIGAAISPGDRVVISGNTYQVVAMDDESTWRPMFDITLRRLR